MRYAYYAKDEQGRRRTTPTTLKHAARADVARLNKRGVLATLAIVELTPENMRAVMALPELI